MLKTSALRSVALLMLVVEAAMPALLGANEGIQGASLQPCTAGSTQRRARQSLRLQGILSERYGHTGGTALRPSRQAASDSRGTCCFEVQEFEVAFSK